MVISESMARPSFPGENPLGLPVEKEVSRLHPDLPVVDVLTTEELLSQGAAPRRLALTLLMLFAILAALLAAVGLYGVLAYTMGQPARAASESPSAHAASTSPLSLCCRAASHPR